MSERKVLNKYYPPDFDPAKIPRLRLSKDRQYTVRLMAPCNMRCTTCGEYIYKGKKFNARKETVKDEEYLGISIFRFYIKCTRCLAEITFKTDPKNTDYDIEHGATRNFQALKLAEEQVEREEIEKEEEEKNNPMKVLENRTKASKYEMEVIENLEELQELNERHASVNYEGMLQKYADIEQRILEKQEADDEQFIKSVFGNEDDNGIKRINEEDSDGSDEDLVKPTSSNKTYLKRASTSILTEEKTGSTSKKQKSNDPSTGSKKNSLLAGLVKLKKSTSIQNCDSSKQSSSNLSQKTEEKPVVVKSIGLGLVGDYSSDSSNDCT